MPQQKTPGVLGQLKTGSVFKVTEAHQIGDTSLTLDGVYRVATAKADHGQAVKIYDLSTTRMTGPKTLQSGPLISIPIASAKTIRVYNPTTPGDF
jgi:hypothetical protein